MLTDKHNELAAKIEEKKIILPKLERENAIARARVAKLEKRLREISDVIRDMGGQRDTMLRETDVWEDHLNMAVEIDNGARGAVVPVE